MTMREIRGHLDSVYAVAFFDALRVKIHDEDLVGNKVLCHLSEGDKDVLGLWIE